MADQQNVNPDGTPYTGALVVLVPAGDDPVVTASSEPAHLTFVWMGELADIDESAQAAIAGEVRSYADALEGPIVVPVMKRGTLGNDDADVVLLERTDALFNLRGGLMENSPNLTAAHDAVEQFPEWTPHVTLGYPDRPAQAEYDADSITFDRISLWLGGEHFDYPMGGAVADPITAAAASTAGAVDENMVEDDLEDGEDPITEIPIHGVAAIEGRRTGDSRQFAEGAVTWRTDIPMTFFYQPVSKPGHDEAYAVGRIDEMWREGEQIRYRGAIVLDKEYASDTIEGILDGTRMGVSVDIADMRVDMANEIAAQEAEPDGRMPLRIFAEAQIAGLTAVGIGAFAETYVGLGHDFLEDLSDEEIAARNKALTACGCMQIAEDVYELDEEESFRAAAEAEDGAYRQIDTATRKKMADAGQAMPDGSFPIANEQDLRNAIQAIGRAKDPDAVKAHIKKRARALGKEGLIPESWSHRPGDVFDLSDTSEDPVYADAFVDEVMERMQDPIKEFASAPGLLKDGSAPQCAYCDQRATQYVLHSEGMAFVPACDDHIAQAKTDTASSTPDGSPDTSNIDRVGKYGLIEETFAVTSNPSTHDGPGWITHPVPTARIRRYWVRGKGAAKIRWGVGGDFNRCRVQLAKYVQNPKWLAGLCANMHYEALKFWPATHAKAVKASGELQGMTFGLTASAAAIEPYPAEWFQNPQLDSALPMQIEGRRVFGYLAEWGTCHVGIPGICSTPPHSTSDYAFFRKGVVPTTEGDISVGTLTYGIGHPDLRMRPMAASAHYDKPDAVRAFVNIGEDDLGIWFAGALAPWTTDEQIFAMRAVGALSGDWRDPRGDGGLELIAAVAVNTPGYQLRPQMQVASGHQTALVAAGVIPFSRTTLDAIDIRDVVAEAVDHAFAVRDRRDKLAPIRRRVRERTLAGVRSKMSEE